MWSERFAPAKVNLYLHVGAVGADGYHPVNTLMVFADVGDRVRLRDHAEMAFRLEGAFAAGLQDDPDNLVVRARDRLLRDPPAATAPFEIVLQKDLPIAAGLGGGSADAAAALVLIAERLVEWGVAADGARLGAIARSLGADVAACLASRSVIGRGRGDELAPAPPMPPLDAVLVNPRAPSATGAVYRAFDLSAADPRADEPAPPAAFASLADVLAFLERTRNDLEAPAVGLQPLIAEVLAALRSAPQTLFSRMSGSGATCFALCADAEAASELAGRLAEAHPAWWVRACRFAR